MRYYWLQDRQTQQQFKIFWDQGANNDADYFTKHHATINHCAQCPRYLRDKIQLLTSHQPEFTTHHALQGCIASHRTKTRPQIADLLVT